MNNAQILTTTGEIKATKIWGKYQAIGRSYGRYDLPDIVAGTAAADRTITLPAKNVVVPATVPHPQQVKEYIGRMEKIILSPSP